MIPRRRDYKHDELLENVLEKDRDFILHGHSESVVTTLRALTPIVGRNNRPTRQAVRAIVDKFETKFTLLDVPVPKRRRIAQREEIIAAVSASIQNEPNQSIPRRSQELGIAQTTMWRIMRKDLGLHAFKIKLTQELKPLNHLKRRNFSNWSYDRYRISFIKCNACTTPTINLNSISQIFLRVFLNSYKFIPSSRIHPP